MNTSQSVAIVVGANRESFGENLPELSTIQQYSRDTSNRAKITIKSEEIRIFESSLMFDSPCGPALYVMAPMLPMSGCWRHNMYQNDTSDGGSQQSSALPIRWYSCWLSIAAGLCQVSFAAP